MEENLVKDLEEIGLSEKEARVYLAALELGPSTAQKIAVKAISGSRSSAYPLIESLKTKGLMLEQKKGKRVVFIASPASSLRYLLLRQKQLIEKKQEKLADVIQKIESQKTEMSKDEVGVEVLKGYDDFLYHQNLTLELNDIDEILELVNIDLSRQVLPSVLFEGDIRNEIKKKNRFRCLYKTTNDYKAGEGGVFYRKIKNDKGDVEAALNIYGDKSVFTIFDANQPVVITITSKAIVTTLKTLFEALWDKS